MVTPPPDKLVLAYNTAEWAGTFHSVLETLIIDLLMDDEPFAALIRWADDNDNYHERNVLITKYEVARQRVHFTVGVTLDLSRIYYIEV